MQPIIARLLRKMHGVDCVLRRIRILAPAITDDEEDGFARSTHNKVSRTRMTAGRPDKSQNSRRDAALMGINFPCEVTKLAATLLITHRDVAHHPRPTGQPTDVVFFVSRPDALLPLLPASRFVIESQDPDPYFRWMRPRGGMDFVQDFVRPGSEDGVRLDVEHNFPRSVITDRIAPENVHRLIAQINGCRRVG